MIRLRKVMCYDAWTQRASNINEGAVTYLLSVQLTKTRTLVFRYTKTIGLLIVTLDVAVTTSQKHSQNSDQRWMGRMFEVHQLVQLGPKR